MDFIEDHASPIDGIDLVKVLAQRFVGNEDYLEAAAHHPEQHVRSMSTAVDVDLDPPSFTIMRPLIRF
jgi:hypothetical protein